MGENDGRMGLRNLSAMIEWWSRLNGLNGLILLLYPIATRTEKFLSQTSVTLSGEKLLSD